MKTNILTVALFMFITSFAFAQSNKEEIDLIQAEFGMDKKAIVAEFIQLQASQKDAFWAIYDEYETKRKELGKKRIDLLKKYVDNYGSLNDETTDEVIGQMMSLQSQTDKLIDTYYAKVKKAAGSKVAAQFYQIEGYVLYKIRTIILENIPLIGELEKKK